MRRTLIKRTKFHVAYPKLVKLKSPRIQVRPLSSEIKKTDLTTSLKKNSQRVEFSVFREKGKLISGEISLKEEPKGLFGRIFHRTLTHSTMGEIDEKIQFKQISNGMPACGVVEIRSSLHGPLGEIHFEKVKGTNNTYHFHSFETRFWAQKEGIGTQVLSETIDVLKKVGAKKFTLSVFLNAKNAKDVIKMYKKFGFKVAKIQSKFPENHLGMVLEI
jgi:ribosomal protein S18 acetylase RimI-like enzyme